MDVDEYAEVFDTVNETGLDIFGSFFSSQIKSVSIFVWLFAFDTTSTTTRPFSRYPLVSQSCNDRRPGLLISEMDLLIPLAKLSQQLVHLTFFISTILEYLFLFILFCVSHRQMPLDDVFKCKECVLICNELLGEESNWE